MGCVEMYPGRNIGVMPIHDWTKVTAGTFHHLHHGWISRIADALNAGLLPSRYYALAEQASGDAVPDVLTLGRPSPPHADDGGTRFAERLPWDADPGGTVAVAEAPPRVSVTEQASEAATLLRKKNRIVVRHASGDEVVALVEIVSPGNKGGRKAVGQFVDKVVAAVQQHVHVLVIDLFPPGPLDPQGMHGLVWQDLSANAFELPDGRPLTLAAYEADDGVTAYVEPTAVGREMPDMPLFLAPGRYVGVPLGATYDATYRAMPGRWREILEA